MKDLVEMFKSKERSAHCNIENNEKSFHQSKLSSKANNSWDMLDDQVTTSNDVPDNVISMDGFKATKEQRQKWHRIRRNHNREVA